MSQAARIMHLSNNKLNAAGLTPDHSLVLPERTAQVDEVAVLQAMTELYTGKQDEKTMSVFSPQVVFTLPNGDVVVGHNAVRDKFAIKLHTEQRAATVHQRLLQTPESLPARTMCIDQVVSCASSDFGDETSSQRMLIVLKRRATDGLVTNFTEEEGHRRATAPLAARAAAGNSFYSPTDNMLSPCTSKLNLAKKKHHMRGTPTALFTTALAGKKPSSAS